MSAHAGQMHSWIANISSATACFTICQTDRKKQLLLLFSFIVIVKKKIARNIHIDISSMLFP